MDLNSVNLSSSGVSKGYFNMDPFSNCGVDISLTSNLEELYFLISSGLVEQKNELPPVPKNSTAHPAVIVGEISLLEEHPRTTLSSKLSEHSRLYKNKRVPITTSLGISQIDGMLKEVCPGETVDSEAAQTKAVFFDSKGNQLSKKASRKLKEEIKLVPANHLLVTGKNKYATRSGRVDSIDRVKQVVEEGPRAIYRDLTDKAPLNVPPTNGEEMLLKNDTLKGSGFRWVKGPNDIYELTHRTHLATGMDSRRDESQFFNPMKRSIEQYSATEISLHDGVKCKVLKPMFSPLPHSPFGQESMSLFGAAGKLRGQLSNTIKNHKDTLISKCEILQGADDCFGTKFSAQFKTALAKIIPECNASTNFSLTDFSGMSNQETLFLKYALYVLGNKSSDIDPKLIFEVGIDSFDDLSGILPHKSCKSGQDRTLTQIAFQETLASYNFKLPETENEKKEFAATFFVNAAMQATPVIEFARGEGGEIKWDIGKQSEQPIPRLILDWLKGDREILSKTFLNFCESDSEGLINNKLACLNKGLVSLNLKELTITDIMIKPIDDGNSDDGYTTSESDYD